MAKTGYFTIIICVLNLCYQTFCYAQDKNYYDDHERGWYWYETHDDTDSDDEGEENSDPIAQMNTVQMSVKRALDQAVLNPTPANVKSYIALQNQVSERSARFSKLWQDALLDDPALDFALQHPTNNLARQVEVDQESTEEMQAIKTLATQSGLFFFYKSTCPYCRAFAPVIKRFAAQYAIPVMPITTDGISLPEFPNSYPDQGQASLFEVKLEPALFVVNPYSHKAIPVGYGLMSEADLKRRILEIAKKSDGELG
jgi:conjugal transfer pilus assembly protein TraF